MAKATGLRIVQVVARFAHGEVVADAGKVTGWPRKEAFARWRECSGFAHGRFWPQLSLSEPDRARRSRGGYTLRMTMAEDDHRKAAELAHALLRRAVDAYAAASGEVTG